MTVRNVLAGVAVHDLAAATSWYERLLASPANKPMEELSEWKFPRGGCLQVFADKKRAGSSSVTFAVDDLPEQIAHLRSIGVKAAREQKGKSVDLAFVEDPDGNQIVFARAHSEALAR